MIFVASLVDRPDLLDTAAGWGWSEWGRVAGRTLEQSTERRRRLVAENGFERCFMLLDDEAPAGMASLVRSDLDERPDLTPWLAGVYVAPSFRGRGHGARVIRAVEAAAQQSDIATLWLYTWTAAPLYRRLGWTDAETLTLNTGPALVMRRDFAKAAP